MPVELVSGKSSLPGLQTAAFPLLATHSVSPPLLIRESVLRIRIPPLLPVVVGGVQSLSCVRLFETP